MNIKLTLCALVACFVATGSLSGQSSRARPRARAAMWTALQLSESQQARVNSIHVKYAPAMKLARKHSGDSSAKLFAREMSEVRELLTMSQQQTFDSYMTGNPKPRRGSVARVVPAKIAVPR